MPSSWLGAFWSKEKGNLQKQCPLDPHIPGVGSWLYARHDGPRGVVGLGCKACKYLAVDSSYGSATLSRPKQCEIGRLLQHAASFKHRQAVVALTGCQECQDELTQREDAMGAPSVDQFKMAWDARRKGGPATPLSMVGGSVKRQRLEFCLAEVIRIKHRCRDRPIRLRHNPRHYSLTFLHRDSLRRSRRFGRGLSPQLI